MKVYEINAVYFLVDQQKDSQTVITFTADQPMPHIYSIGATVLSEEFLTKATLCIDESFFLGCLLFPNTCVYYFYGAEVQTLLFRLPRQIERVIPKQLFKETEILAFFKALRVQNCLSTYVHSSAFPTLPELTFYAMFCDTDAEALRKLNIVTRFSIGYKHEHIYVRRDWTSGQKERKASILYYLSCNLADERPLCNAASSVRQLPLITTNYNEALIDQEDPSVDNFVEQLATILTYRSQRIRRLYFANKKHCEALGPALSRYDLTPVVDREHAELKIEFAIHPLILSLTTDYQLILDMLLEQINAFGNSKEKRLNRVLTAATVNDLAERLLLQLDTKNLQSSYLNRESRPSSDKQSPYQHKVLGYAHKLISALSTMICPVSFAPFNEAPFGLKGKSIYFQSNISVSSAKQIVIYCSHLSLGTPTEKSLGLSEQVPPHTIPSISVFVGSKRCPEIWYKLYESHQVGLHIPVSDISMRRSSIIQESGQDNIPREYLFFSLICGISWGDSSLIAGLKPPFDFDLIRVDQHEDSQFTISHLVVPGFGTDTGLSLCSAPSITEATLNVTCHLMAVRHALNTIITSLLADHGRSKSNNQISMSNCYAVARYMNGESAIPTIVSALTTLMQNQEQGIAAVSQGASQPLLVSIYYRAQQLVSAAKTKKKGTGNKPTCIDVITDSRWNFAFTHGLLSILRAQMHEKKVSIPLIMVVPNPMTLEIIRLLVLYMPTLLESSNELKIILGTTSYEKLYKSASYFNDAYIKLAASLYKLASSTFLAGFIKSDSNTLFSILSPQVHIKSTLYARLRSAAVTNTLSLGEVADKFEQMLLEYLQEEPTKIATNLIGLSCSNCGASISEDLRGDRCAKCQLPFCVSCSLLCDQIFYSSYDFETPASLCPECAGEESLLEPIHKILASDKTMTESARACALLNMFDQELANKLKSSVDGTSMLTNLPDEDLTELAILSSFCEHLAHNLAMPVTMRLAGAYAQLHLQNGCVCTRISQDESSVGPSSPNDCRQQTQLLIKPTSLLQTLYLVIPSNPFSEMTTGPSITSEPKEAYGCKEIPTLLSGVHVFQFTLNAYFLPYTYSFQMSIPATTYYIIGFTASTSSPREKPPTKVVNTVSLSHTTPSMQCTNFSFKPGSSLLECEVKLTSSVLTNQRLIKYLNSTIFLSVVYPYRTIVKLSAAKPNIVITFKFPTARAQRNVSPQLIVYHLACLSDSPLDRERRRAREGLIQQASDGIVTAVQILSLPLLSIVNKQELTYQFPLSLRSAKSTMRLLFASAEQHAITEISETV
ncbi:Hypothetical protein GLP15_1236 [Giardia lamblia P15]|uniref:Uncharacterized protein n=1 Tax=Giardia intestinalis (strain P15) TaxID=658858 RepID=E1EZS5_GIAIA|nr:Hypothetical protein GLP15_1236 [Giardia lamblia P15]